MRNHAIQQLEKLAKEDDRVMLLSADLGYNVVNGFEEKYKNRFINVGIAEQSMSLIAAGLALSGNVVFTYSIGNFPTLRCIEQIRNDICYHNANVKILSVGGGFAYGDLGMTHHATEDIAMMRALPNMRVYVPSDPYEAEACINEAYRLEGPAFVRMAKGGEPFLHSERVSSVRKMLPVFGEEPADICIIAAGPVLAEGIHAAEELNARGHSVSVFSCPTIKPLDKDYVREIIGASHLIVSIEEHNVIGGLGGALAEAIAETQHVTCRLLRIGLPDTYTSIVGNQAYLRDYYGMSSSKIVDKIEAAVRG